MHITVSSKALENGRRMREIEEGEWRLGQTHEIGM